MRFQWHIIYIVSKLTKLLTVYSTFSHFRLCFKICWYLLTSHLNKNVYHSEMGWHLNLWWVCTKTCDGWVPKLVMGGYLRFWWVSTETCDEWIPKLVMGGYIVPSTRLLHYEGNKANGLNLWAYKTGSAYIKPGKWAVMHFCVGIIDFASFNASLIGFLNCSDSVVFFVFLLDFGTVLTVWYFFFFIFWETLSFCYKNAAML